MSQEIIKTYSSGTTQSHTKENEFTSECLLRLDCKREVQCFNPGFPGSIFVLSVPVFNLALLPASDWVIYQTWPSFTEVYLNNIKLEESVIESSQERQPSCRTNHSIRFKPKIALSGLNCCLCF